MAKSSNSFWSLPFGAGAKQALLVFLVSCFGLQTFLVYLDPSDARALSAKATHGRRLWLRHNCQSCRQLYGFGGFPGPDLTNRHADLAPERLEQVLTHGSELMPAYGLLPEEIEAIRAFLAAMDATGRGQARLVKDGGGAVALRDVFENLLARTVPGPGPARGGLEVVRRKGCFGCHLPLAATATYPDLSTVTGRLSREEIRSVLEKGRNQMPPAGLSAGELDAVHAFVTWLADHRGELREQLVEAAPARTLNLLEIPWWEFR